MAVRARPGCFVVTHAERDQQSSAGSSGSPPGSSGVRLAEAGVVLRVDGVEEVSEESENRVKYIAGCSVLGLVRVRRVLNPQAFFDRSTYLRVEVEEEEGS